VSPEQLLLSRYGDDGSDFQHLVDYGGYRYHLALLFNNDAEPDAFENATLMKLYRAMATKDDDEINRVLGECEGLLYSLMKADYNARSKRSTTAISPSSTGVIKLRALTVNGVLQSSTHDLVLNYPPNPPVDNTFPGVPVFRSSDIEQLHEQTMHVFKVRHKKYLYCLKSVHRSANKSFIREVSTLKTCSHSNIVGLIGVTVNLAGKVDGMLTDWIENARRVSEMDRASIYEAAKWIDQIKNAVNYLHEKGLVWGDAKAGNVLITVNGDAMLVDFGGGFTEGWVEQRFCETVEGGLRGLERIISFINEKVGGLITHN